jgi:hypothetical protein
MPKGWTVNTKSAQAKARKDEVRREENDRKQKEMEDKMWAETDKQVLRKLERKDEKEKQHAEKLAKKEEAKRLLEEEMSKLKGAKPERHVAPAPKLTQFEIQKIKEKEEAEKTAAALLGIF